MQVQDKWVDNKQEEFKHHEIIYYNENHNDNDDGIKILLACLLLYGGVTLKISAERSARAVL